jgi:predicted TIM-barrel fold metal-dependent hydrolase
MSTPANNRFFNTHAHCFTYDHVPAYFISKYVAVSWLLSRRWLRNLFVHVPETRKLGFWGKLLLAIASFIFRINKDMFIRYLNFVKYGDRSSQEDIIKTMQFYYPKTTGFVFLTMDMEYMGAGLPPTRFEKQLTQLEGIKRNPAWTDLIYPFVFCDPRRLQPRNSREVAVEKEFIGSAFENKLKDYLRDKIYQGIKLYPALGYFPFDKRMKSVYDFAVENNIPLTTHCIMGAVHFKYQLTVGERLHPFLNATLPELKPAEFQQFYTHPLNYECLMNHELLKTYWGEDAPNYSKLKICLGHWGGEEEWNNYIENAWSDVFFRKRNSAWPSLELDNWIINEGNKHKNLSWFTIICDLMRKYENVYADISYTLEDEKLLPLLKFTLEIDAKIRERVLFGTDFYVVSKAISERKFGINVRSFLGETLFHQIAVENPRRFLSNNFNNVG